MSREYRVKVALMSQKKRCHNGHRPGDEWIVGRTTPEGMCMSAFGTLFPFITTLKFGGSFPWESEDGVVHIACPDGEICNLFRLERLPEED